MLTPCFVASSRLYIAEAHETLFSTEIELYDGRAMYYNFALIFMRVHLLRLTIKQLFFNFFLWGRLIL
jgi:hypothetical protein